MNFRYFLTCIDSPVRQAFLSFCRKAYREDATDRVSWSARGKRKQEWIEMKKERVCLSEGRDRGSARIRLKNREGEKKGGWVDDGSENPPY